MKSGFLSEIQKFRFCLGTRRQLDTCGTLKTHLDFELLFGGNFHTYEIGIFQLQNYTICNPGWKLL